MMIPYEPDPEREPVPLKVVSVIVSEDGTYLSYIEATVRERLEAGRVVGGKR